MHKYFKIIYRQYNILLADNYYSKISNSFSPSQSIHHKLRRGPLGRIVGLVSHWKGLGGSKDSSFKELET